MWSARDSSLDTCAEHLMQTYGKRVETNMQRELVSKTFSACLLDLEIL